MRHRGRVEMFNFSFLDVLATVLGVLLFILLFAILNQSELHQQSGEFERSHLLGEASEALEEAKAAGQRAQDLQMEIKGIKPKIEERRRLIGETAREIEELTEGCRKQEEEVAALKDKLEGKGERMPKLPYLAAGGRGVPFHIDCAQAGLTLLGTNIEEGAAQRELCPPGDIGKPDGLFGRLIEDIVTGRRSKDTVIVFWVRPDGIEVGRKAMDQARSSKVRLGYEPADQNWIF